MCTFKFCYSGLNFLEVFWPRGALPPRIWKSSCRREAAITFGKAATGNGRVITMTRCIIIFFGKHNGGRCGASSAYRFSFCATRRECARLAWYANDFGGVTTPPCRLSAGLVPVRLRQTSHTKRVPEKAAIVEPTEHLKQAGQLQCWAKGLPPNSPPRAVQ